jgi:integrase
VIQNVASFTERDGRWRALVRKAGRTKCATFDNKAQAKAWAATIERELDQLKATGVMAPRGLTLADLIDRYTRELYPVKPWGRSKSADLARLKDDLGDKPVTALSSHVLMAHFRKRLDKGMGRMTSSSQLGYLVGVLRIARTLWQLDVPLQAAEDARTALTSVGLNGKSKRRDRRVADTEIKKLLKYFEDDYASIVPMADIVRFCVASGMRISEVCRLQWADLNTPNKTIIVRNRKHPKDKLGNDQTVPLLNATGFDAYEIANRQPHLGPRIFEVNPRTVSAYFTDAVDKLNLPDLRLHDLRHESISRLFDAGYRIEQVALVSGHRDWAMLKRYTHVRAADLHRVAK